MIAVQNNGYKYIAPIYAGGHINVARYDDLYPDVAEQLNALEKGGKLFQRSNMRWKLLFDHIKTDYLEGYYEGKHMGYA
jgi:hypothetical protein